MPKKKTTTKNDLLIALILDKSGSMMACHNATISAYNEFKADQAREGKKLGARTRWALTLFDTEVHEHKPVLVEDAPDLDERRYIPGGCTALYDAVGRTLHQLEMLGKKGELPGKVLVVIQTDGQENSSREFTQAQVFEQIGRLGKTDRFAFSFLGADQDAYVAGGALNIPRNNTVSYDSVHQTGQTFSMLSAASTSYRTGQRSAANLYTADPQAPVSNKPGDDGLDGDPGVL